MNAITQPYDICVLGAENSGKSSFVQFFLHDSFIEIERQIEDLYTKVIRDGNGYNEYTILDMAVAHEFYLSSRKKQLLNMAACILVYAVDSYTLFEEAEELYERLSYVRSTDSPPPVVVVGTKCDLPSREISYEQGQELATNINALGFFECLAKEGVGINNAFEPLIEYLAVNKKSNRSAASRFLTGDTTFTTITEKGVERDMELDSADSEHKGPVKSFSQSSRLLKLMLDPEDDPGRYSQQSHANRARQGPEERRDDYGNQDERAFQRDDANRSDRKRDDAHDRAFLRDDSNMAGPASQKDIQIQNNVGLQRELSRVAEESERDDKTRDSLRKQSMLRSTRRELQNSSTMDAGSKCCVMM